MSAKSEAGLEKLLSRLNEEDVERLNETPRHLRLSTLSSALNLTSADALKELSEATNLPVLEELEAELLEERSLPMRLIHEFQIIPVSVSDHADDGRLTLASVWPPTENMDKWVYAVSGKVPKWYLGTPDHIMDKMTEVYGVGSGSLDDSDLDDLADADDSDDEENENAAIIKFINEIVMRAIEERATDIHFEPQKESLQIRYRIDGRLDPVRLPENLSHYQSAIISRLKIMARLNISEKRRPQDGRISFELGNTPLDIRISTLPTMYGESVSLRLLNQKNRPLSMTELGLLPEDEVLLSRAAKKPHGIILVTGPTGSGKSTTLTAVIRKIQTPELRIITVEDPVEYEVPGINQTQVQSEIGLDFAAALRTVLRQDPDVIMVGEIRDRETADIAIRASLTGHLVLSTLHTNDSAGALTRLTDMGIEPFLIASSVELIIAQRLVRRLNPKNAISADYSKDYVESCIRTLKLDTAELKHVDKLRKPGSESHAYYGRLGVFEMLPMSEEIHELVVEKATARVIRQQGIKEGMRTLQQCGWEQCKHGATTLEEIVRLADAIEESG